MTGIHDRAPLLALLPAGTLLLAACGGGGSDASAAADTFESRMAAEHEGDRPVASGAAAASPAQEVSTDTVTYATVDGREVRGYYAEPAAASDSLPGLIVIHEWWGLNENIRSMTRRLAGEGYRALAVDLYGGAVASSPDSASQLTGSVEEDRALSNLRQAHRWLGERGAPRVGSIGWCFGGGWSLQTALALPQELDASIIYYGRLVTDPGRLEALQMPLQGHFGAEDDAIPVEEVRRFEAVLDSLGRTAEMYVYEGADHAFANPSGTRYAPEAAKRSWARTLEFLDTHLTP